MTGQTVIRADSAVTGRLPRFRFRGKGMTATLGRFGWLTLILCLLTSAPGAALAERRVALVIGNADYQHADQLANTTNDAHAMTALFKRAGFDSVLEKIDVGVLDMKRAVREFASAARNADIAVVYYSGHGIEVGGVNYLIPVDARLNGALDVDDEAVALDRLLAASEPAARLSLVILDACRENPFTAREPLTTTTRGVSNRLLAAPSTGGATLVAYAAKAGSVSYDGAGPNSPFTTALVKYLDEPGLDIRIALGKVRDDVLSATNNQQEPYVYGSLGGGAVSLVAAPTAGADAGLGAVATDYAMAERIGTPEVWQAFLSVHSGGFYGELARAQLAKLGGGAPAKPAAPPVAVATPKATPEAAVKPVDVCQRDATRLAELRRDPTAAHVDDFERQLACEALRPQLARLRESLGLAPLAAPPPPTPMVAAVDCARDRETLERLRVAQNPGAVVEFARTLGCAALKPQVDRLMESLGVEAPTVAVAQPTRAFVSPPAAAAARSPVAADSDATCAQESADLARLRADPKRDAVMRFATAMRCAPLKPQVTRLLESLGD